MEGGLGEDECVPLCIFMLSVLVVAKYDYAAFGLVWVIVPVPFDN